MREEDNNDERGISVLMPRLIITLVVTVYFHCKELSSASKLAGLKRSA